MKIRMIMTVRMRMKMKMTINTCLIDKKSQKNQRKDIQKKKLLNIIYKIKKSEKKKQEIVIRTCQRKKKTKSKSIKRKGIKN